MGGRCVIPSPRPPAPLQWGALAAVALLLVVFGLFRIDPFDVPEHLAVGRILWESGSPMTTNTLSWTYPDYPNHQQYPLYQVVIHLLSTTLGFWSLSVFCCVSWVAAAAAWGSWAGGPARAAHTVLLWFVAVLGVQRHLVARPEVFTLLGLGLLLVAWAQWRARPRAGPLVAMLIVQWVMVNTHQMYVVGNLLIVGFAVHVAITRQLQGRGTVADDDAELPRRPLLLTAVAAFGITALSPLGVQAWVAPLSLVSTVVALGAGSAPAEAPQSAELAPIWTDPIGGPVAAILLVALVVTGWRARGRWSVLELGVVAMGLGMVALALRGIPFFALAAAAVATRWDARAETPLVPAGSLVPPLAAGLAGFFATVLIVQLSIPRPHAFERRQQGLGRSVGEWADHTIAFLRDHPPPGEMLNIGWVAANYLNYGVYPIRRVFVDGRWEAYPKPFLVRTMAAEFDQDVLDGLIEEWQPGFVVAEMREPAQLDRIATLVGRGWPLVFVDSITAVAVRPGPGAADYAARFRKDPATLELPDALPEHPILHAQQQIRLAGLLRRLGEVTRSAALRAVAAAHADHPAVQEDLAAYE